MTDTINRTISSFLNTEVKEFARYVLETRCCPRLADGLRTGARKTVYAGLTGDLSKKHIIKMLSLMGDSLKMEYHHGDTSLLSTIVQLSRADIIKFKPFEIIGQVSDLRYSCSVAPRYLEIKKDKGLELFSADKELWEIMEEGGVKIEPKNFLPIIPIVLLYRTNSPGFGFSYRSFSYSIDSIIDNCIKAISTGSCIDESMPLKPNVEGCNKNNFIYNYVKECWFSVGEYSLDFDNDTLNVFDLPYSVKIDSYTESLTSLKNRLLIKDWMNLSNGDSIKFVIKFEYGRLKTLYNNNKWNFYQMFRLFTKVPKDTLNVLDDNNNILQIENPYQLIDV
jgi:DNA topoisomerase-2